jgi:hypothetical protein
LSRDVLGSGKVEGPSGVLDEHDDGEVRTRTRIRWAKARMLGNEGWVSIRHTMAG